MHKTFDELGFKPGDKVQCLDEYEGEDLYRIGKIYTIEKGGMGDSIVKVSLDGYIGERCVNGYSGEWKLISRVEYEDKWELNDGKVQIPDDADKLEKDGSVVAFRRKKRTRKFKRGDRVVYNDDRFPSNHPATVVQDEQDHGYILIALVGDSNLKNVKTDLITLEKTND